MLDTFPVGIHLCQTHTFIRVKYTHVFILTTFWSNFFRLFLIFVNFSSSNSGYQRLIFRISKRFREIMAGPGRKTAVEAIPRCPFHRAEQRR